MTAKQQQALFSRAYAVHQAATTATELQNALELYRQTAALGRQTFRIEFNAAAVCLSLSEILSNSQAQACRDQAAAHLDAALALLPNNLEALIARAAVEDAYARTCPAQRRASHRERATGWLRRGADAELNDAPVRVLLAEAYVLLAESAAETARFPMAETLLRADAALREARWLLDARAEDLARQPANPNAELALRDEAARARLMGGKLALARLRLMNVSHGEAMQMLRRAEEELRTGSNDDAALTRAEILEAMAELDVSGARAWLQEAGTLCKAVQGERRKEATALLGDLCLALVRNGETAALSEGVTAYTRAMEEEEVETFYNFACLIALGLAVGSDVAGGERRIGELLKKGVDLNGVTASELRQDEDLKGLRDRPWFGKLVEYAERRGRR